MEIDAAVATGPDRPLRVARLLLDCQPPPASPPPVSSAASSSPNQSKQHPRPRPKRRDEILVRIVATGVCHTDVAVRDGHIPFPMPAVLGHEGCGVVEAVGWDDEDDDDGKGENESENEGSTAAGRRVRVGDHVVMCFASCNSCPNCSSGRPSYCRHHRTANFGGVRMSDGSRTVSWPPPPSNHNDAEGEEGDDEDDMRQFPVHGSCFQQSSFATYALCTESNCVVVPKSIPLSSLAPLGCSVNTGAGAVLNSLQCRPGSTIAIFGVGGVGMCSIMAAAASGCAKIVAVDVNEGRLELAKEVGANHAVNSTDSAAARAELMTLVEREGGYDYALDTTGIPAVLRLAVECLRPTGVAGLIGGSKPGAEFTVDMLTILLGRTVRGIIQGDARPKELIPKLIELHRLGKMPFDKIITYYDGLERINDAVRDSADGTVIKPVIRVTEEPPIQPSSEGVVQPPTGT